jgi:hypothetical protein
MQGHPRHISSLGKPALVVLAMLGNVLAHASPQPVVPSELAPAPVHAFALPEVIVATDTRFGGFGVAARSDALDAQRGGTDTVNNNMNLDGGVHDNVAHNVVTGANSIDAGSFANMSGIPTVIQNSGANVLIQNATIINLQFK